MDFGFPKPHVVLPKSAHLLTVVLLHGRGSNGSEFAEDLFETIFEAEKARKAFANVKWVFPTTKSRYSTQFQEEMTEWFDIVSLADPERDWKLQVHGLWESTQYVSTLIENEIRILGDSRKIIIGGISQGLAVATQILLSFSLPELGVVSEVVLGGFVGWCGWLPFKSVFNGFSTNLIDMEKGDRALEGKLFEFYFGKLGIDVSSVMKFGGASPEEKGPAKEAGNDSQLEPECWARRKAVPILLSHNADDDVVDIELGRGLRDTLTKLHFKVDWKEFQDGGHWLKEPQAAEDFIAFLAKQVAVIAASCG